MKHSPRAKRTLSIMSPKALSTNYTQNYQWIMSLNTNFHNIIQKPIALRQTLLKNAEHPRCMQHNIILSTYCTLCRKALCASCMYTSSLHRTHKIIPLPNATQSLKEDVRVLGERIPLMVQECIETAREASDYLISIERNFDLMSHRLKVFYQNLRNFIKKKELEQIQLIRERKDLLKSQAIKFSQTLQDMLHYLDEKFKTYGKKNTDADLLLPFKGVLENLLLASPLVKMPKSQKAKLAFGLEEDHVEKNFYQITFKINQLVPNFQIMQKNKYPKSARSADHTTEQNFFKSPYKFSPKDQYKKKKLNTTVFGQVKSKKT